MKQEKRYSGTAALGIVLAGFLAASPATAQLTESYTHVFDNYDVKNYSMEFLGKGGLSVMAGTMYDPALGTDNSIHLLVMKDGGSGPATTIVSRRFNDAGYDERAIGAHFVNEDPNDIVLVASRIDVSTVDPLDKIEIIRTDGSGSLVSSKIISSVDDNFYPVRSMTDGRILYICGYSTKKTASNYPQTPQFQTRKRIMVIQYDLYANTVLASRLFDYPLGPPPFNTHDYDMATHIKKLSSGNLFVTGSCNAKNGTVPNNYCGTLALILDDQLNIVTDQPHSFFLPPLSTSPTLKERCENGFDIQEDPKTGGYFIFGNMFFAETGQSPWPEFFMITYVDPQLNPLSDNRYLFSDFDYAWGNTVVPSDNPQETILSGYQSNMFSWMPYHQPSSSNVNPFLAKYDLSYDFGLSKISANVVYWSTILSDAGTGAHPAGWNNFIAQGGYFNNLAWAPVNTARSPQYSDNIYLTAPIWGVGNGKLNMKVVSTNGTGELRNCPYYDQEKPHEYIYKALPSSLYAAVYAANLTQETNYFTETDHTQWPDRMFDCSNDWVYKPTGIDPVDTADQDWSISLNPNPAHDYVVVDMPGKTNADGTVNVSLTDIGGKHLADLYTGKRSGLQERKLELPVLIKGLYLVTVRSGGVQLKAQKLEVR